MEQDEIQQKIKIAIKQLFCRDHKLLDIDVNERTITHRLAMYLQKQFPDWDVDCEYNRKGHDNVKRLNLPVDSTLSDCTEAVTVYPDIIVHHRTTEENLLVIEVKKSSSIIPKERDLEKLRAYKSQLGYRYAVFLRFATGNAKISGEYEWCWI